MLGLVSSTTVALFFLVYGVAVLVAPRKALPLINEPTEPPSRLAKARVVAITVCLALAGLLFSSPHIYVGYANAFRQMATLTLVGIGLNSMFAYRRLPKPRAAFPRVPFIVAMFVFAVFAQFR